MADHSRDPTIGWFAASNLCGRPYRQVSMTKRNLVAHLPWARTIRLQQLHRLLTLLCVFSNLGNVLFAQSQPQSHENIRYWHTFGTGGASAARTEAIARPQS